MTQITRWDANNLKGWNVTNPVFKRNVLMKPSRMASWARKSGFTPRLTFSCLLTKNQIAKLCSVINGVLEVGPMNLIHTQSKHAACGYELSLQSERLSQPFNPKNSLSTIESQILQHIKCSITEDSPSTPTLQNPLANHLFPIKHVISISSQYLPR